jgi:antibiotic biosynthesis monooxygenase (ABM) superfamily enzyme
MHTSSVGEPLTLALTRHLSTDCDIPFRDWQHKLVAALLRVPGFEGAHLIAPPARDGRYRTLLVRFRDANALRTWETCSERDELLAEAETFSTPHYQWATGLEAWLVLPSVEHPRPARWKLCALMFPASYLISTIAFVLMGGLAPNASLYIRNIPVSLAMTVALTYGALPALTRHFKTWLYR